MTGAVPSRDGRPAAEQRAATPIERSAKRRLAESGCYARQFEQITVRWRDGVLTLQGRLPSFYLKQVLQTLLRNVEGVNRIDNQVKVEPALDETAEELLLFVKTAQQLDPRRPPDSRQ
jgi:osmotically-inducible protein OsmY